MDETNARMALNIITTVAAVVWLISLVVVAWAASRCRPTRVEPDGFVADPAIDVGIKGAAGGDGAVEIEGRPADLTRKMATVLTQPQPGGSVRVLERSDERLVFEGLGSWAMPGLARCRRGELTFRSVSPDQTEVRYHLEGLPGRGFVAAAATVQVICLVALVLGYWLISTYVVPDPRPNIRGQVFQMIQIVHFLWPPMLLAALGVQFRRLTTRNVETLLRNLPYTG